MYNTFTRAHHRRKINKFDYKRQDLLQSTPKNSLLHCAPFKVVHSNFRWSGDKCYCLVSVWYGFEVCYPQKHHMQSEIIALISWPFYPMQVHPCIISSTASDRNRFMLIILKFCIIVWPISPSFHALRNILSSILTYFRSAFVGLFITVRVIVIKRNNYRWSNSWQHQIIVPIMKLYQSVQTFM